MQYVDWFISMERIFILVIFQTKLVILKSLFNLYLVNNDNYFGHLIHLSFLLFSRNILCDHGSSYSVVHA